MFTFFLSGSGGWDVNSLSYSSKSYDVSEDNALRSVFFKSDGLKMYVLGDTNDTVYQYSLSTAWSVNTASYDTKSKSVSSEETQSYGLTFKNDGTAMYIVGNANKTVYQYTLSTPWDVGTASYASKSKLVSTEEANPAYIFFKYDGTSMYITGPGSDKTYQYTLSSAWDVSTASYASKASDLSGSGDTLMVGGFFDTSGVKLFAVGQGTTDSVYEYVLGTPWDASTSSYTSKSFSVASQDSAPWNIFFRQDGRKMYLAGATSQKIFEYDLI